MAFDPSYASPRQVRVFFERRELIVFFEIILVKIHAILPEADTDLSSPSQERGRRLEKSFYPSAVVIALAERCQAFCVQARCRSLGGPGLDINQWRPRE